MIYNILFIGSLGSFFFTIWLVFFGLSGWVKHLRDDNGKFLKKWSWQAALGIAFFIAFLIGVLVWGNIRLGTKFIPSPSFSELFLNSFGIFFFIHLYDLVVIDYLLIVKWHPKFLKLPSTEYYTSITPHAKGFLKGIPIGILGSAVAATITWTAF